MVTGKAGGMPVRGESTDHSARDKLGALPATRSKKYLEVMLAILSVIKLIEYSIWKWLKTLCTYKSFCMEEITVGVDDFLIDYKIVFTTITCFQICA